jgi:hypothetical protein
MNLDDLRQTEAGIYVTDRCRIDGDCLLWAQAKNKDGYGCLRTERFGAGLAHRALWTAVKGKIKHRLANKLCCGHRHCVNPDHWQDIRGAEVISRQYKRGVRGPKSKLRATGQAGHSARPNNKGSREKALEAKALYRSGMPAIEIAEHFGISKSAAHRWVAGKAWAPLSSPFEM